MYTEERSPDVPDNSQHQPSFSDAQLRNGGNHPNDRRFHERSSWIQGGPGTEGLTADFDAGVLSVLGPPPPPPYDPIPPPPPLTHFIRVCSILIYTGKGVIGVGRANQREG